MEAVEHLVALKVMRLTRPTIATPLIVTSEKKDLPGNLFNNELRQDVTTAPNYGSDNNDYGTETIGKGQFLLLPQSFGNIFLGEIFSSYICVHNETSEYVQNVSIKADLQTSKQRVRLSADKSVEKLGPDDTLNDVIHHEVKEIGTHILVCEVSYQSKSGSTCSFRKFFKFMVNKPLDVKTKFYNTETDEVYLEAQVRNITSGPICLEKVALDASNSFTVKSLNCTQKGENVFGDTNILEPQSCCQFLYCLIPNEQLRNDIKTLMAPNNIGKLDIVWRSNLGEKGRLQTSQLEKMGVECHDIRLIVKDIPNCVLLEDKVMMTCKVINCCDRKMELSLELEQNLVRGFSWCCRSGYKITPNELNPTDHIEFNIEFVPIKSGFLTIGGVKLIDTFLNRTYEFDQIAQIYVVKNATKDDLLILQ